MPLCPNTVHMFCCAARNNLQSDGMKHAAQAHAGAPVPSSASSMAASTSTATSAQRFRAPHPHVPSPVHRPADASPPSAPAARGPAERRSRGQSKAVDAVGPLQSIHVARPPPPPGSVPTDRRKIPAKSRHQTAKYTSRQNPHRNRPAGRPEHASPYGVSPHLVAVSGSRRFTLLPTALFSTPLCAPLPLCALTCPSVPPASPQARALGSPRRVAAGRTKP